MVADTLVYYRLWTILHILHGFQRSHKISACCQEISQSEEPAYFNGHKARMCVESTEDATNRLRLGSVYLRRADRC